MQNVWEVVLDELQNVAGLQGITLPEIESDHRLTDELGLESLDLAFLVTALERRLGVDPFLRLVPITSVRTVGDLCDAYRRCLAESA
ncbi:MAG TPA: acyl carrier protein [Pirellulaceae bacterium]|nr:acyl carrier protein [Pirellulaceae bacterium]